MPTKPKENGNHQIVDAELNDMTLDTAQIKRMLIVSLQPFDYKKHRDAQ